MNLEIHYDPNGEWAALYVDGRLDRVGDAYLAEEKAFELLGVTVVQDDAFLRGQDGHDGVAQTLDEVAAFRAGRTEREAQAQEKRRQAAALLAEATALEGRR